MHSLLRRPGTRRSRPYPARRACRRPRRASSRSRSAHAAARARRARAAPAAARAPPRARSRPSGSASRSSSRRTARGTRRTPCGCRARFFSGIDLAVADREDRLHVQQVAGERGRATDAPALREVLERVHREEQVVLALVALDERVDLLVGRPALEPLLHADREQRDRRGRRCACRSRAPGRRRASRPPSARSPYVPDSVEEICSEMIRSYFGASSS